jgi:hypothetical protein
VGSYTITFTPDDSEDASAVVRVDLAAAGPRITELTVRAGTGDGLVPGEVPGVDLGRLLRAIAPSSGPAAVRPSAAEPGAAEPAATQPAVAQPAVAESTAVEQVVVGSATTRKQTTAKQTTAKQTTAKQATAPKTTAARKRTASRTVASAEGTGRNRAYRRAPGDVVEVYSQAPSAAALASHYGVPRHTVQGWLRRLRAEGALPAPAR